MRSADGRYSQRALTFGRTCAEPRAHTHARNPPTFSLIMIVRLGADSLPLRAKCLKLENAKYVEKVTLIFQLDIFVFLSENERAIEMMRAIRSYEWSDCSGNREKFLKRLFVAFFFA